MKSGYFKSTEYEQTMANQPSSFSCADNNACKNVIRIITDTVIAAVSVFVMDIILSIADIWNVIVRLLHVIILDVRMIRPYRLQNSNRLLEVA